MKKTLLKFSSIMYLIAFRKFSKAKHWEINLNDLTVVCDCSDKEALSACRDFRAVLVAAHDEVPIHGKISELGVLKTSHPLAS
jgi:hypothetical protein